MGIKRSKIAEYFDVLNHEYLLKTVSAALILSQQIKLEIATCTEE